MLPLRLAMTPIIALLSFSVIVLIIIFPGQGLLAAERGLVIWWDVLFPSLLPFLVISEMMLGFGMVHFFGSLLDPMMRPLFRVPGIGGFVMAMGFASGYMVGARLTSQLWDQRLVNREEGERLVAFTSTSDPIFLIGVVSVGFFHDPSLALILAIAHYGGSVLIGFLMRFHGAREVSSPQLLKPPGGVWRNAFKAMHHARIADGRSIGTLLRQSVETSLRIIFVIGGLVVFFSVVLELLTLSNVMDMFFTAIHAILQYFSIPGSLSEAVVNGLFEVTLGAKSAGNAGTNIALINKVAIAAFVLSWSGLSVHAQIVSLLHHTNLRYRPFVVARLLHGIISFVLVYLIWNPIQPLRGALTIAIPSFDPSNGTLPLLPWTIPFAVTIFIIVIAAIIILYAAYLFAAATLRFLSLLTARRS